MSLSKVKIYKIHFNESIISPEIGFESPILNLDAITEFVRENKEIVTIITALIGYKFAGPMGGALSGLAAFAYGEGLGNFFTENLNNLSTFSSEQLAVANPRLVNEIQKVKERGIFGKRQCYATVLYTLNKTGFGELVKPSSSDSTRIEKLVTGGKDYNLSAKHFAEFMAIPNNLEKYKVRNLLQEKPGLHPNDPRVPPGAVIVIKGNMGIGGPHGDINIKVAQDKFYNYGDISNLMKTVDINKVAGIYVPETP